MRLDKQKQIALERRELACCMSSRLAPMHFTTPQLFRAYSITFHRKISKAICIPHYSCRVQRSISSIDRILLNHTDSSAIDYGKSCGMGKARAMITTLSWGALKGIPGLKGTESLHTSEFRGRTRGATHQQ